MSQFDPSGIRVPETAPAMVRQGDVLLVPADEIPDGAKPIARDHGRVVLAYGEVTGHAHAIAAPGATLLADGDDRYLRLATPRRSSTRSTARSRSRPAPTASSSSASTSLRRSTRPRGAG